MSTSLVRQTTDWTPMDGFPVLGLRPSLSKGMPNTGTDTDFARSSMTRVMPPLMISTTTGSPYQDISNNRRESPVKLASSLSSTPSDSLEGETSDGERSSWSLFENFGLYCPEQAGDRCEELKETPFVLTEPTFQLTGRHMLVDWGKIWRDFEPSMVNMKFCTDQSPDAVLISIWTSQEMTKKNYRMKKSCFRVVNGESLFERWETPTFRLRGTAKSVDMEKLYNEFRPEMLHFEQDDTRSHVVTISVWTEASMNRKNYRMNRHSYKVLGE